MPELDDAAAGAVFIDKDGTLIEDVPFNVDPARLRFTVHALSALRLLADRGHPIIVVTNQPGIALGRFKRAELGRLEQVLASRLRDEAGIELAGFYACPHAPGPQGRPACLCRKPAPGLLRQAARSRQLDLSRAWMIGDILDDIEAGRRAGCRTVLLDVGHETVWHLSPLRTPHHTAGDLLQAAQRIVGAQRLPASAEGGSAAWAGAASARRAAAAPARATAPVT